MTKITLASAVACLLVVGLATGADAAVRKHDTRYLESKPRATTCSVVEQVGPDSYCFIGSQAGLVKDNGPRARAY
jgi:hypothetical protein